MRQVDFLTIKPLTDIVYAENFGKLQQQRSGTDRRVVDRTELDTSARGAWVTLMA